MSQPKIVDGTFVEGIGDDVVRAFCVVMCLAVFAVAGFFKYRFRRAQEPTIHIASSQVVAEVREIRNSQSSADHLGDAQARRQRRHDLTCPVCLGDAQFPVETNCGHLFCGQCIITYWETGNWLGAVRCPSCRQQVTVLLTCFSEDEMGSASDDKRRLLDNINLYNRRFSGQPLTWMEYLIDLPTMLRHCLAEFFSFSGLLWMFRLRVLLCFLVALLYLVSPLDIIPEAVFGFFGLLDDLFIVLLLAIYISVIYRRLIAERAEAALHQ